jgi:hypothetical protein
MFTFVYNWKSCIYTTYTNKWFIVLATYFLEKEKKFKLQGYILMTMLTIK